MPVDTKSQILDAAEALIAEKGINAVSLRTITAAAKVNLAAVRYHFGSKAALVGKVYERRLGPINQLRLQMLDAVESAAGDSPPDLQGVLRAIMAPPIRMLFENDTCSIFNKLCGRIYVDPSDCVQTMFDDLFQEVDERFMPVFERALPDLPETERAWRVHFAIGSMIHTLLDSERLKRFTHGQCNLVDREEVIERLINFTVAGLTPPIAQPVAESESSLQAPPATAHGVETGPSGSGGDARNLVHALPAVF